MRPSHSKTSNLGYVWYNVLYSRTALANTVHLQGLLRISHTCANRRSSYQGCLRFHGPRERANGEGCDSYMQALREDRDQGRPWSMSKHGMLSSRDVADVLNMASFWRAERANRRARISFTTTLSGWRPGQAQSTATPSTLLVQQAGFVGEGK